MKISIVTISFNQAAFLERALRSVLDQNHPDLDYIVVDPGSTDGSREIIERYRPRLARVILDPDRGPADGLNHGLAAASGEVFGYLNADDRLLPGALARVAAAFAGDPAADVVHGHGFIEDLRSGESYRVRATGPVDRARLAFGGAFLLQQSTFFRTGAVRDAGGFNPANRTCWDMELIVRLVQAGRRFRRLEAELGVFTLHRDSISGGQRRQAEFVADWRRLFTDLVGRAPRPLDRLRGAAYRAVKWLLDPAALAIRLRQAVDRHQRIPDCDEPADLALIATHIAPAAGYGGVASWAGALVGVWARQGRRFRIVASDASTGPALTVAAVGMPPAVPVALYRAHWFRRWGFGLSAPAAILRAVTSARAVYIAGIATWPTTLAALLCRLLGRRYVVGVHGGLMPDHVAEIRAEKPLKWLYYRLLTLPTLAAAAAIHAASELEADGVRLLLPAAPVTVSGNGVDLALWRPVAATPAAGLTLCYVGRSSPEKGILKFLRLWLETRRPEDRFLLVGGGTGAYADAVEALAREAGPAVTLFGYLDQTATREAMAGCDVLVMPSGLERGVRENFGNAVVEALALGRPVLVTRGLAWDDVEAAGVGFVMERDDPAVGAALRRLQLLPASRLADMGRAARHYVEAHHDLRRTADAVWGLTTGRKP